MADQGLFAVANFVLNVLLARWLTPQDYGAFTIAFAVFLLIGTVHTALLAEPMLVFGPGKYKGRLYEYLGILLYGHLGFAFLSSLLLLLASLGFALSGSSEISAVLLALVLVAPFIFLLWLMRRACYAVFKPHLAAWGGAIYMVLMMVGVYALYRLEWLSAPSALGVMGLSSTVVSLWLVLRLKVKRPALKGDELVGEAFRSHWSYGRWSVAYQALAWVPANVYFLILPVVGGLEDTASLKALLNLLMPILHANMALSILLLPSLVQARGSVRFSSIVRSALVLFVSGSALYWLFLIFFHGTLITWLYGGRYAQDAELLWFLGLAPISAGVAAVLGMALRARERPDQVFYSYVFSSIVALTLGLGATLVWGTVGAAVGLLLSSMATAVAMAWLYMYKGGAQHR